MPAISTAIGLGLAGASAASSAIGKHKAASAQAKGADAARSIEEQNQQLALTRQDDAIARERKLQDPYIQAGGEGLNSLRSLLSKPGEGLLENYGEFSAPTGEEAAAMPGYKFAYEQGIDSLDKSAAARGNLFSGTQGTALQEFGQGLATTNYQQAYQDALNSYLTNRDTFETNQGNQFNRLGQLAGVGQHATDVLSGQEGATADQAGAILTRSGEAQAQQINNAAAARASGYRGVGDSIASGLNYGANWLQDSNTLDALNQQNNTLYQQQDAEAWRNRRWQPGPA